jgi:non-ribosomal peptide synthase protein (TIGR01720 family)
MLGVEQHHDALRLRFTEDQGRWSQRYVAKTMGQGLLWRRQAVDTAALTALANECQRSLDLQAGPLWRALHVEMADAEARILLVIHHLVVDTVSWRVLLEDLQMAYEACSQGRVPQWPIRTSSYRSWVERLAEEAPAIAEREASWWLAQLGQPGGEVPCDNPRGRQLVSEMASCRQALPTELTRQLLKEAPAAFRTQINDLLLTALSRALCQWSGQPSVLVQLEGHGREDLFEALDLSRSVGWFTSIFPVRLTPTTDVHGSILATQQQLAQVPQKGIGYGVLRYLGEPSLRKRLAALPQARVTFNYMGQFDQSFDDQALLLPAPESSGDCTSPHGKLANWLEIVGHVYDGRLTLRCDYSRRRYRPQTVEALMHSLREQLEAIVGHCLAQQR